MNYLFNKIAPWRCRPAFSLLFALLSLAGTASAQNASVDFRQFANKPSSNSPDWTNAILNQHNSEYYEGTSTPQRIVLMGIPTTSGNQHVLRFNHQARRGGPTHAYDFLTSLNRALVDYQQIMGKPITPGAFSVVRPGNASGRSLLVETAVSARYTDPNPAHRTWATVPTPASMTMSGLSGRNPSAEVSAYDAWTGAAANRAVQLFGNQNITNATLQFVGYTGNSNNQYANYELRWTSASSEVLILTAGHLAIGTGGPNGMGYGAGKGSSSINGAPYHVSLESFDNHSTGSRDNQIQQAIAVPPSACNLGLQFSKNNVACYGGATGSITLTATSGTGPFTFRLTNPNGVTDTRTGAASSATFTGLSAGTYQGSVSVSTTCFTSQVAIPVGQPASALVLTATPNNPACSGGTGSITASASGGTSPYRYALDGGALGAATTNAVTFSGLTSGPHVVRVVDAQNCEQTLTRMITVPTAVTLMVSSTPTDCKDYFGSITAMASGGTGPYTYVLTQNGIVFDNNTSGYFAGLSGGLYTVTATDANSCNGESAVAVGQVPPCGKLMLTVGSTPTDCKDYFGSITASANGGTWPYTYVLTQSGMVLDNNSSGYFAGLSGGTYTVTVTDANFTSASENVVVGQVPPCGTVTLMVSSTPTDCKDYFGSITAMASGGTGPYAYVLMQNGMVLDNNSSGYFAGLNGGTYTVMVKDVNLISASEIVVVGQVPPCGKKRVGDNVVNANTTTAVARTTMGTPVGTAGQFGLVAFPNPTSDHAQIEFQLPESGTAVLTVYSALGQKVTTLFDGSATANKPYRVSLNAERLANGVYSYTLRTASGSQTRRLVVQH